MLATLFESRIHRTNSFRAQILSVGLHAALITGAVWATQRAAAVLEPDSFAEPVHFVPVPAVATPSAPRSVDVPKLPGFQVVTPPLVIPDVLPPVDVSKPLTDPNDFTGAGAPGGNHLGVGPVIDAGPLTEEQVDLPARLLAGSGRPTYPEALRNAGLAGEVNVQFVVDTTGRADMSTLAVLSSTNERFTEAVRRALERARFGAAEVGGMKVRQVVRMPFVFSIAR